MMADFEKEEELCDGNLLKQFAQRGAGDAFSLLVGRHIDLVYSAARAVVRDRQLAEDVTQEVFLVLVRKAGSLNERRDLAGWLYHAAVLEARTVLRKRGAEARRIEELAKTSTTQKDPMRSQTWQDIEPHVNEALEALNESDREAVVLRYYQRRPYESIAQALGVNEATARQRVHRALDRLREALAGKGVVATASALGVVIKLNAVVSAPEGLAAKTVAAATSLTEQPAVPVATVPLGAVKSKLVAALILGTASVATAAVVVILAIKRHSSEVVYVEPVRESPANVIAAVPKSKPAVVRPLYQIIQARTFDENKGTRLVGGFIAWIGKGDWLRFNRVDLGDATMHPMTFTAAVDCPDKYAGNTITVHVDRVNGPVVALLKLQATGSYGNWRSQSTSLSGATGVHDLFLEFSGGGWNLDTFKLTPSRRSGVDAIAAISFNEAKGVMTRGGVVCETSDGYWVRYNGLEFGGGVNAVALTYSCGNPKGGGSIEVRLDGPDGPLLGEMPVQSTGNWGAYTTKILALREVAGTHDVVLKFSGKWHGIVNLHTIQFLHREDLPATLPATAPAGVTRQEAGLPLGAKRSGT